MSELMDANATTESPPKPDFLTELKTLGNALPDKAALLLLLAAWVLLFQYVGWTSTVAGKTGSLFAWMWGKWDDPSNDAGHGKLIPFVVLAILWARRERLVKSAAGVWWPPLLAVGLALALHVAGFVVQQPRLSMIALFFGAWGLVGLVWGWEAWKVTFFPFFIFAFCLPMGGTFAQAQTLPLRQLAAQVTMFIAHGLLQIDVVRNGTELLDAHGRWHFEVAAECSGIRSFVALLAISTIFSVLTMRLFWKRAVMIALTVPIALICNVVRLSTIILAATAFKSQAAGAFVDNWFGYVTYMIGIAILLLAGRWLREKPGCEPP
jgi:exosortase